MEDLTREENALLYVLEAMEGLAVLGIVVPGIMRLTEDGKVRLAKLRETGYRPTTDELILAARTLRTKSGADLSPAALAAFNTQRTVH